jgi:cell division protein ZapE
MSGSLQSDAGQRAVAARLDVLAVEVQAFVQTRSRLFARLRKSSTVTPRGLYIHGGVGRGKTMLMDLFFDTVDLAQKRRAHFHAFMADVHDRIAMARKSADGDPIAPVAREIAAQAKLLCFDELFVTDIADAMILGRLFRGLFEAGVVVVATSNVAPDDLYRDGLNRQLFLPFIDEIEDRMEVLHLDAGQDFRLQKLSGRQLYFSPVDAAARAALDAHWLRLTGVTRGDPATLTVKGRALTVPQAAMGVARMGFADLCEAPLSAIDYLALSRSYHTVLVDAIPVLGPARRDVARRFITLIDTLYDNRVGLIASAEAEPDLLYPAGSGADHFVRTASRLMEMRSDAFLAGRAARGTSRF